MDYAKLKAVILTMPGEATATDEEVLSWGTTPSVTKSMPYSATTRSLMADLGPTLADSILSKLEAAATADSVVKRAISLLAPAEGGLDMAHPNTRAALQGLLAQSVLSQSDYDALLGLSDKLVGPFEAAGLSGISEQIIHNARAGSW